MAYVIDVGELDRISWMFAAKTLAEVASAFLVLVDEGHNPVATRLPFRNS